MPLLRALDLSKRTAVSVAVAYLLIAAAWIWLSDWALLAFMDDPERISELQTLKGWGFVGVTAAGLYLVLTRQLARFESSATLLRFLVERLPDVLFRFRLRPDRGVDFVSPSVKALSGYSPKAFEKDPRLALEIVHPEDRERLERYLANPDEVRGPVALRWRRPDGTTRWMEAHASVVRDPDDRVVAVEGMIRDVTERHETERLRRLLEAAVEATRDAVIVTDATGRIEYVNPAFERITGWTAEEARGENPRILKSGRQSGSFYRRMWEKLGAGEAFRGEFVNRRKDGSLYRQEATITPVVDDEGRPTHYVGVARDVTERQRLEKQLREAQKAEVLGHASGGIAHDCRNILGVIQAHADLALEAVEEGRSPEDDLKRITDAVQRGSRLLSALLSLGRKEELQGEPACLGDLVREMRPTLRALFPQTVDVEIEADDDLMAKVDPGSVHQMVLNLATNARDAMPEGGRFTLRVAPAETANPNGPGPDDAAGGWIQVVVTDTGTGIDGDTLERVFEPLFTTKSPDRGTGLGLSMVARLVEAHGGRASIDSEVGKGTTARLFFPALDREGADEPSDGRPSPERAGAGAPRGSERVLIVEDEEPLRRVLTQALERLGYRVVAAANGREALRILEAHPVDLVMTDLIMPEMGGRELLDEMRLLGFDDVPVIFMSGYQVTDVGGGSRADGFHGFLEKPWTLEELAAGVRQALDRKSAKVSRR